MEIYTASQARENFFKLINRVAEAHEPVYVTGKSNKVVIISAEDYKAMQETLYFISVPGMKESILEGRATPIEDCSTELDW